MKIWGEQKMKDGTALEYPPVATGLLNTKAFWEKRNYFM